MYRRKPVSDSHYDPEDVEDLEYENKKNKLGLTQWAMVGPGMWGATGRTIKSLDPGFYSLLWNRDQPALSQRELNVDDLVRFENNDYSQILDEVEGFWARDKMFSQFGFLHRRGYLLYGPPGSGKSCLVQMIIQDILKREGIILNCSTQPNLVDAALTHIRSVEPKRPIVCLFEDIDALIDHYGEDALLSILDGENQVDTVLSIATTNYPEKLDKRIIGRPRRFDRVIKIGMPAKDIRLAYFKKKFSIDPNDKTDIDYWVEKTEGLSFAALADLFITVKLFGNDFETAVENLKRLLEGKATSEEDKANRTCGLGSGSMEDFAEGR